MNQKTSTQTRFLLFFLFPLCSFLFVFSCLNPLAVDKDGPAEYTADGRRLVNVSVKASTRGGGLPAR
jgi:hypothetical protein